MYAWRGVLHENGGECGSRETPDARTVKVSCAHGLSQDMGGCAQVGSTGHTMSNGDMGSALWLSVAVFCAFRGTPLSAV